jgi:superfamily I DNA and/or RNA helicase
MNDIINHLNYFKKIIQISSFPKLKEIPQICQIKCQFKDGIKSLYLDEDNYTIYSTKSDNLLKEFEIFINKYLKSKSIKEKLSQIKNLKLENISIEHLLEKKKFLKDNEKKIIEEIIYPKILVIPYYFKNKKKQSEKFVPFGLIFKFNLENYKEEIKLTPFGIPSFSIDNILLDTSIPFEEEVLMSLEYYNKVLNDGYLEKEVKSNQDVIKWNKWLSFIDNSLSFFEKSEDYEKVNEMIFSEPPQLNDLTEKRMEEIIKKISLTNVELKLFKNYIKDKDLSSYNNNRDILMNEMFNEENSTFTGQLKINRNNNGFFSLNNEQRLFIRTISDGVSDVLALNGPPGTGKTTVLQSVIATLVVKSITDGNCEMPIIFGLAATNQAKNNIIDGFKIKNILSDNYNKSILSQRWIKFEGLNELDYGIQLNPKGSDKGIDYLAKDMQKVFLENNEHFFIENFKKLEIDSLINEIKRYDIILKDNFKCSIKQNDILNVKDIESAQSIIKKLIIELNNQLKKVENKKNKVLNNFKNNSQILKSIKSKSKSIIENKKTINVNNEKFYNINERKNLLEEKLTKLIKEIEELEKLELESLEELKDIYKVWNIFYDKIGFFSKIFNKKRNLIYFNEIFNKKEFKYIKINKEFDKITDIEEFYLNISKFNIKSNYINRLLLDNITSLNNQKEEIIKEKDLFISELNNINSLINTSKNNIESIKKEIEFNKLEYKNNINNFNNLILTLKEQNIEKILNDFKNSKNYEKLFANISAVSDNLIKPLLFNLSMKYYEAKFIIESIEIKKDEDRYLSKKTTFKANKTDKKYKLFSNIFPVFVSTMHSLIKNMVTFDTKNKDDGYLFNFIDYAIIDESGQCSPEIGAISFLFSKKAIVVGDTDQIEPVYAINEIADNIIYNKFTNKNLSLEDFNSLPYNCSTGSVMKIAQNNSLYNPYEKDLSKGLYLLEHRRCPIEIISYCNKLVYGNYLQYSEGSDFENFTKNKLYFENQKPWNFVETSGEFVSDSKSKNNKKEAEKIAEWLVDNYYKLLEKDPNKKIEQILAILTPYAGQEIELKKALRFVNKRNLPENVFQNLVVGTAHKLQGAERDIILFSSTWRYSEKSKKSFIDNSPSIINVVISRAKQSIYVFGEKDSFEKSIGKSTKLMWEYLKNDN